MVEAVNVALRPPLREKWGWFVALGVALIMGGGIAFGNVLAATVASVYYVGMIMLIGGALHLVQAFPGQDLGKRSVTGSSAAPATRSPASLRSSIRCLPLPP